MRSASEFRQMAGRIDRKIVVLHVFPVIPSKIFIIILPINTTRLGLDETAELIKEYVKLRGYMK